MTQFIRNHAAFFATLGTGLAIGAGVTLLYQKIAADTNRQIRELAVKIEALYRQLEALKTILEANVAAKKKRLSGYQSMQTSSGDDDDDEFEEASEMAEFEPSVLAAPSTAVSSSSGGSASGVPSAARNGEAIVGGSGSPEAAELYRQVDKLLEGNDDDQLRALDLLSERERKLLRDPDFMWRFAKATYMSASINGARDGDTVKKELMYKAHEKAKEALQLTNTNSSVHKWYAITIAGVGDYESTQVKLQNGFKYREHIERAIELNPKDASSYYLLGRWLYAVYMLSWIERQAAATLFGASISANIDDALTHFKEADNIDPGNWKDNLLHIAKCYIEKRDYYAAAAWLQKADKVPTVSQDDKVAQKEVDSLLYKYGGYSS